MSELKLSNVKYLRIPRISFAYIPSPHTNSQLIGIRPCSRHTGGGFRESLPALAQRCKMIQSAVRLLERQI